MAGQVRPEPNTRRTRSCVIKRSARFALLVDVTAGGARGYRNAVIFIADAQRNDRRRFVTHADENLMAFVELDSAIRAALHKIKNESSRQAGDNYIV